MEAKLPEEAKPPHQHSQPQPSPATRADILSVSSKSTWEACLRAYSTSCTNTDESYECTCNSGHRLQLSRNLWDSLQFLALVPSPGRPYLSPIEFVLEVSWAVVLCSMLPFLLQVIRPRHTTCRTVGHC